MPSLQAAPCLTSVNTVDLRFVNTLKRLRMPKDSLRKLLPGLQALSLPFGADCSALSMQPYLSLGRKAIHRGRNFRPTCPPEPPVRLRFPNIKKTDTGSYSIHVRFEIFRVVDPAGFEPTTIRL